MKLVIFNSLEVMNTVNFISIFDLFFNLFISVRMFKTIATISIGLLLTSCNKSDRKIGYIDINIINKEFIVAQQFEEHLKQFENKITSELLRKQMELNLSTEALKKKQDKGDKIDQSILQTLFLEQEKFEKTKKEKLQEAKDTTLYYRELLNTEINKNVFNFGKENHFEIIYNPAGSGVFMYADSTLDITSEVVKYLNQQY